MQKKKKPYKKPKITCSKKMDAAAHSICDSAWDSEMTCRLANCQASRF